MKHSDLSASLTVRHGGLSTGGIATAFGVSRPRAWKALRALELRGLLTGEARGKGGDYVDRKDDGRPATVGAEILWLAPMDGNSEGVSAHSDRAAAEIINALAVKV